MLNNFSIPSILNNYCDIFQKEYNKIKPSESIHDEQIIDKTRNFYQNHDNCFSRNCLSGHFTASAWLINQKMTHVVLTHHKKLNKWLQLGGHADNCPFLHEVALKEAYEESGLTDICFPTITIKKKSVQVTIPFDLDIHLIPEHQGIKEHHHYDFRYLLISPEKELIKSAESHELRWFEIDSLTEQKLDPSIIKLANKFNLLKSSDFICFP